MQTSTDRASTAEKRQLVIHANYEFFILGLTLLQVANSILWLLLRDQEEGRVIVLVSTGISLFLIGDSVYRLARAHNWRRFLFTFHGWLLWIGSLPIPFVALLRLLWYWLAGRTLRRSDFAAMVDVVVEKRAQNTLMVAVFSAVLVLEAAASLILGAESGDPQANIQDAGDAVWWTFVTVATVGYGDKYPVTSGGRLIGVLVMIVGVGLFSVLTSFLAQWFIRSRHASTEGASAADTEDKAALLARLDALAALVEQQGAAHQADTAGLHARLAQIEDRLAPARKDVGTSEG